MRVTAFCNWTDTDALIQRINRAYGKFYSPWFIEWDKYNPEGAIVFNRVLPYQEETLREIPKERIIGFVQEPPDHDYADLNQLRQWCGKVITCTGTTHYNLENGHNVVHNPAMFPSFEWYIKRMEKTKKLSFIVSNISGGYYDKRLDLVKRILNSDLDCDIYGRGIAQKFKTSDKRMKGFIENKDEALIPYEYSIAIENGEWIGYASEKITDCFGTFTIPIYRGAPNAEMMFPNAMCRLSENHQNWINEIREFTKQDFYSFLPAINDARKRIMSQYNILTIADDFFAE